jgi:tetratricopeptide (TPR) repeat protein
MEQFLDQAETLLRDVTRSHSTSMIVALHRLRDLAEVLDNLELYDECRLAGNCALDLVRALGQWSLEFKQEQADTLALIAGLSAYQPSARTFFIEAVTIYQGMVAEDTSYSRKLSLLSVLGRASYWADDHPELGAQWLEQAVQLMTNELPSTMVPAGFSSSTYHNYGICLGKLEHYDKAMEMSHIAVSLYRTLANENPVAYTSRLAGALMNMGKSLVDLGQYGGAAAAYKEALENWRTASAQDPLQWNTELAHTLCNYGIVLLNLGQISKAAKVEKEAVSLYLSFARTEAEYPEWLGSALHNYGWSCHLLGQHEKAVLAFKECILLWRTLLIKDHQYTQTLANSLHDMAISLHFLERNEEANAAASECIRLCGDTAHKGCQYEPNLDQCFVCHRVTDNVTACPAEAAVDDVIANRPPTPLPLDSPAEYYSSLPTADITPMAYQPRKVPPMSHGQLEPLVSAISTSNVELKTQSSLPPAQEILPESPLRTVGARGHKRGYKRILGWFGRSSK